MNPLSYPGLQSVLQHMDPNLRVQISSRCPSTRTADLSTPMKTAYLLLSEYDIIVNDTIYGLGIIKKYSAGKQGPLSTHVTNYSGGEKQDVDKFGLQVSSKETEPGDIVVDGENDEDKGVEHQIQQWRNLEQRMQAEERADTNGVMRSCKRAATESLLTSLLPYRLKFSDEYKDTEIPFKHYIQLSIRKRPRNMSILHSTEVLEYNRKLSDAMKYLVNRILQKPAIKTKVLEIYPNYKSKCYFRLPETLKISVDHLKIRYCRQAVLDAFRPVLSGPLEVFEEHGSPTERNYYTDPIVTTSRKLIITQSPGNFETGQLTNKRVHSDLQPGPGAVHMITSWIENRREIGTHYSYDFSDKEIANSVIKGIERLEGAEVQTINKKGCADFPNCITIPMGTDREIELYVEETPKAEMLHWILHFKINSNPSS